VFEQGTFARLLTVDGWFILAYELGPPLVRAILLAIGTWIAARLIRKSAELAAWRADASGRLLVGRIVNIVVIGLGVATILDAVGVPLTTFVTVIGVAGLGISLAMQDVLKSFVAGTFLLFERPFRIGDEISIKDQRGVVEHIGIRTTRLRNPDNVQIVIPNGVMFAEIVSNRTYEIKKEPEPEKQTDDRDDVPPATAAPPVPSSTPAAAAPAPPLTPAAEPRPASQPVSTTGQSPRA
jgi:small-conductance mechanosensitive channel